MYTYGYGCQLTARLTLRGISVNELVNKSVRIAVLYRRRLWFTPKRSWCRSNQDTKTDDNNNIAVDNCFEAERHYRVTDHWQIIAFHNISEMISSMVSGIERKGKASTYNGAASNYIGLA